MEVHSNSREVLLGISVQLSCPFPQYNDLVRVSGYDGLGEARIRVNITQHVNMCRQCCWSPRSTRTAFTDTRSGVPPKLNGGTLAVHTHSENLRSKRYVDMAKSATAAAADPGGGGPKRSI